MEIKTIENENIWNKFFDKIDNKTFLQSWEWGRVYEKLGNKIFRIGLYNNDDLVLPVLIIKINSKKGNYFLIQHLSFNEKYNSKEEKLSLIETLLSAIKDLAKKEKVSFLRIAPLWHNNIENQKIFSSFNFINSPFHASAYEATLKLKLNKTQEEIFSNFRKTTRYIIRKLEQNKDIKIIQSNKVEDCKIHQDIIKKTANFKKFVPFPYSLTKTEFETFLEKNQSLLFFGLYKDKIIGSSLVVFWSNFAFYHQAGFDPDYNKLSIAYIMQWEIIKEAKRRNCSFYDFWGYVDPTKNPNHPWSGPSLFKMGFGGDIFEYVKTKDYPLSFKYIPIYCFEKIRAKFRGF